MCGTPGIVSLREVLRRACSANNRANMSPRIEGNNRHAGCTSSKQLIGASEIKELTSAFCVMCSSLYALNSQGSEVRRAFLFQFVV